MSCSYRTVIVLILTFLAVMGHDVRALPEFDVDVVLEEDLFYTLPQLPQPILRYNFTSTLNGSPYDTNLTADIIEGEADSFWEDTGKEKRHVFDVVAIETTPLASTLGLDTERMISEGSLRSDCEDISLYDGQGSSLPYVIEGCGSNETLLRFLLPDDSISSINLYHSGDASFEETIAPYRFYEDFKNMTVAEESWDFHGNITIEEGYAYTDASNITSMNLTALDVDSYSEITYGFFATGDSVHNITLSQEENISVKSYSIEFDAEEGIIEACWWHQGSKDCSRYRQDFAEDWNELRISIEKDHLWLYLNDERLNRIKQYYNIDDAHLSIMSDGLVFMDHFSILEKASTGFNDIAKEKHIDRITGLALQGDFGFKYSLEGFSSGNFTIATRATRPDLYPQHSFDHFTTRYERIIFDSVEEGYVNELSGRYLVETGGKLTLTNPNDNPLSVDLDLDTPIIIEGDGSPELKGGRIKATIDAFSSIDIDYFVTGVTNFLPIGNNEGVLVTHLKGRIDEDLHEIGHTRFFRRTLELEDAPRDVEEVEEPERKELRFVVDDDYFFDVFTRMSIMKHFSHKKVEPGDVVEVFLRVTNHDPFSREVKMWDDVPEEFVLIDKDDLSWNFKMNKHTSRILDYEMKYVGNSTGRVDIPPANLTSQGLLVFSNQPLLMRHRPSPNTLDVTKRYRPMKNTEYRFENPVKVRLSVSNLGERTVREIILDDAGNIDMEFSSSSVSTVYTARWVIPELRPGETWEVEYITDEGNHVLDLPSLDSYVDDIDYSARISEMSSDRIDSGIRRRFSFSVPMLLTILALSNIMIILYYVYKNPFFEVEDEVTPKRFVIELYEQVPAGTRRILERYASVAYSAYKVAEKHALVWFNRLRRTFIDFKGKAKNYYEERNISLVKEKSSSAISKGVHRIDNDLSRLKRMTLKDWVSLFSRYKAEFFTALRNRFTYSMFSASEKMLQRNPDSKMGQIMGFSAKVLNPELKHYLAQLTDKKLKMKEESYRKEIQDIERLLEKNEAIAKGSKETLGWLKRPFRRFLNFFKR